MTQYAMSPTTWPRLSETLTGPKRPDLCQSCGSGTDVHPWVEYDEDDRPDRPVAIIVCLCVACSDRIIEPHPRLYHRLHRWEPRPGMMALCVDCRHRSGTGCAHPDERTNGGEGLRVEYPQPGVMFVDAVRGGKRTGWHETLYTGPPTACAGRDEANP